jgi:phospholipid/cholesterol/gamma-HCH transport system substrate-binding protein
MNERIMQFRVGLMVLVTILIAAILILTFGGHPTLTGGGHYNIYLRFKTAPNVAKDTPIRKSGIFIGRVADVELRNDEVLVTARIESRFTLYHSDVAQINPTLLGDTIIQFFPAPGTHGPAEPVKDGETLEGITTPDPLELMVQMQAGVGKVFGSVEHTSNGMGKLVDKLNDLLDTNRDRCSQMVTNADKTLIALRTTMDNFNDLLADPAVRQELKTSLKQLPGLFRDAQDTFKRLNASFDLVDENLRNVNKFTQPLGERGPALVSHVDAVVQDLDTLVGQFSRFGQAINNPQGTVGQLIHNPELYQNLNDTVARVNELTRQLRPILDDARVFTDKIARHPESLGVRGALERQSGLK